MNVNTSFNLLKSFIRAPHAKSFHPTLKMRAVHLNSYGPSLSNLELVDSVSVPLPDQSQVLIKVNASSLNPLDNEMRKGYAKSIVSMSQDQQLPLILGRDCSGEVVQVGSDVWDFRVGDKVWAANAPFSNGTHAGYVVMNEGEIAKKPRNLNDLEAASVPFAALTAWNAIFSTANITPGMRVLVNGANGGVGFFSVNLLKKHLNCIVGATCNPRNFEKIRNAGADIVFDYNETDSQEWNDFDVVLNCVDKGEEVQNKCIKALKKGGHYVSFNSSLVRKSDSEGIIIGLPKGIMENKQKMESIRESSGIKFDTSLFVPSSKALAQISRMFESNILDTNIGKVFPLSEIKDAYQYFEDGKSNGKIVFDHSK